MRTAHVTHGMSDSSEHGIWRGIRLRCRKQDHPQYDEYGGRGIYLCFRWMKFENFYADLGARPSPEHSVDRIDCDGPYAPWNCRWATPVEQQRNRRDNQVATKDGKTLTIAEWSEITGLSFPTLARRFRLGLTEQTGLFAPPNPKYQRSGR